MIWCCTSGLSVLCCQLSIVKLHRCFSLFVSLSNIAPPTPTRPRDSWGCVISIVASSMKVLRMRNTTSITKWYGFKASPRARFGGVEGTEMLWHAVVPSWTQIIAVRTVENNAPLLIVGQPCAPDGCLAKCSLLKLLCVYETLVSIVRRNIWGVEHNVMDAS